MDLLTAVVALGIVSFLLAIKAGMQASKIDDLTSENSHLKLDVDELKEGVSFWKNSYDACSTKRDELFEERNKLRLHISKLSEKPSLSEVDLTRQSLGLVTSKEIVDELEKKMFGDKDVMKQVTLMWQMPAFHALIDTAMLTFKDKLAAESHGREADLLNRGAIAGAGVVKDSALKVVSAFAALNAGNEPLKGAKRFKTIQE